MLSLLVSEVLMNRFFFFKQKTAYEMRISDWSSDVCSSDLVFGGEQLFQMRRIIVAEHALFAARIADPGDHAGVVQFVGEDHAARQQLSQRRERRIVRDIAAGEQQCAKIGSASCRESVCQYV